MGLAAWTNVTATVVAAHLGLEFFLLPEVYGLYDEIWDLAQICPALEDLLILLHLLDEKVTVDQAISDSGFVYDSVPYSPRFRVLGVAQLFYAY